MATATEFGQAAGRTLTELSGLSECLDRLAAAKRTNRPLATYRLQFNKDFRFGDARRLVPYLHALGISHCYASPLLKSRPGSPHGYDIIDHNAIDPEIGTEEEFRAFTAELKAHGMGLVLDLVPNHMGVGASNPWWQDVLENGLASEYSGFFDIDWHPLRPELCNKVLLPILGGQYGDELESGELRLEYNDGRFFIRYYDKTLPIDPQTIPLIFEAEGEIRPRYPVRNGDADLEELESVIRGSSELPLHTSDEPEAVQVRKREVPRLQRRLAGVMARSAQAANILQRALRTLNGVPGDSRSFDHLHRLLEAQAYRLAHWRVSAEEINYRRFFDINDLVGLRMENPRVFAETHKLVRRLLAEGSIAGVRIDHPDGLFNPAQYFTRLQMLYAASQCCGPIPKSEVAENGIECGVQQIWSEHDWVGSGGPVFVAAEKILEHSEELPLYWLVDGTTGYEFANQVNGIFIDQRNQRAFSNLYQRFAGQAEDVATLIYESKKLILDSAMSGEVAVLSHLLDEISSMDRRARDFTHKALRDAIREVIACFPVYRTYIDERGNISERDRSYINESIARARRRNESTPAAIFEFLRSVLLLAPDLKKTIEGHRRRLYFTLKFQQLTGPVMAKGLEDTACYVYNRFISVNEVGGSPDQFGISVDDFHAGNMKRLERWPNSMLATTTHDTKRSEDVRARLNVLSEMPSVWSRHVLRWRRTNRVRKKILSDGRAVPDANEEYLLYQTLAGIWPAKATPEARAQVMTRVQEYMTKAVHEAKRNLSWVNPNQEYIDALRDFIARILQPGKATRPNSFLNQLESLAATVTYFGAINSLAQTLLKLTSPGIPDVYQGCELTALSLVDPDNRRPVDFRERERLLQRVERNSEHPQPALLEDLDSGAAKMQVIMRALRFRRDNPELFREGSYTPLFAGGGREKHLCSFVRECGRQMLVVTVPRLSYTMMQGKTSPPIGDAWEDTELVLSPRTPYEFINVLTGEQVRARSSRTLLCREIFASFPVALLASR
jgi:(1->4)-alpha-D-glucan 1-alpha-D-glucosylmutase